MVVTGRIYLQYIEGGLLTDEERERKKCRKRKMKEKGIQMVIRMKHNVRFHLNSKSIYFTLSIHHKE